jgi:DNA polymerase III subunit delta'
MTLFDDVVGQRHAVEQLRASASAPVHAYLMVGPPGSGKRSAARSFAAALLCPHGGCGVCRDCVLARREDHPDVVVFEREGAFITADQCREMVRLASLSPVEGARKVIVAIDLHLVQDRAPILLKTLEEPPASTVFVVLAEDLPPELETIASRCVQIQFGPVPSDAIADALASSGLGADMAAAIAEASGGRIDRARLLAADPSFGERQAMWREVPARLDGTGTTAAAVAAELHSLLEAAAVGPLQARHAAELAALEERVAVLGERGSGRRALLERHKREQRRLRIDELRFGLATLARSYRDSLAGGGDASRAVGAIKAIDEATSELLRNPSEALLLQALLTRLRPAAA